MFISGKTRNKAEFYDIFDCLDLIPSDIIEIVY